MRRLRPTKHAAVAALAFALGACTQDGDAPRVGANDGDFLPVDQAFPYTAFADEDSVALRFELPDGYYLYRNMFGFSSRNADVALDAPLFPAGRVIWDEFKEEDVEIYRGEFAIEVPYRRGAGAESLPLTMKLQGCADAGLCYVPQTWQTEVALPPAAQAGIALFDAAPAVRASSDLLPLDEAFQLDARFDSANELVVSFRIAPDYYLYRDKFTIQAAGAAELGRPAWPQGVAKNDENFGDVEVFYDYAEARVPLARGPDAVDLAITVGFQGCKENSVCYPPAERTIERVLPAVAEFVAVADGNGSLGGASAAATGGASATTAAASGTSAARTPSEQDRLADVILGDSWTAMLLTFYGAGLLLALTPCVWPMVPILSGIIAGQGAQASPLRGFALSLTYVLGMAATYTTAGALAALAGGQVQAVFQKPWIIALFAAVFVVLALGMFGVFKMQMPTAIQSRIAGLANRQRGGTFAGTAAIGALSALIVTTCVAPALIAALTVIGERGDVLRGSTALFTLSMGMGTPLLIAGTSAGSLLPKAGPWMNAVKGAVGVVMLGMAVWLLERVLPGTVTLALWAVLVFMTGVFLGAFEPLTASPPPARRIAKGAGVLACLYGAILLLGATLGGDDPLQPLARVSTGVFAQETERKELQFRAIESVAELETALADARAAERPVMVDFTADWCTTCKELEKYTFPDQRVVAALESFTLLRADVTENDDDDAALLKYFNAYGPPTISFYDASGRLQEDFEIVQFLPAEEFSAHARRLAAL